MNKEKVFAFMSVFMSEDFLSRICVSDDVNGKLKIISDLHGLGRYEAKRTIKNVIASDDDAFIFEVIHGYNHGTVIKDMIASEELSERIVKRYCKKNNPGVTVLEVAPRLAA